MARVNDNYLKLKASYLFSDIARRIAQMTQGSFDVKAGSLFPALYRLERQKLLQTSWGTSENNRRAKYYKLTQAGRNRLREETAGWNRIVGISPSRSSVRSAARRAPGGCNGCSPRVERRCCR